MLAGQSTVAVVRDPAMIARARESAERLNAHLTANARGSGDVSYVESLVTGGGVTVGCFPQLFLLALDQGCKQPPSWADYIWQILAAQGQLIIRDRKPVEGHAENRAELNAKALSFAEKQLPVLTRSAWRKPCPILHDR